MKKIFIIILLFSVGRLYSQNTFSTTNIFGTTNTIKGVTTNNNAIAGNIGEYISHSIAAASSVSLANGTSKNIDSLSLTAGDWDVCAIFSFSENGASVTQRTAGVSSSSASIPTDGTEGYLGFITTTANGTNSITITRIRFSLSGTTKVYLIGNAAFSAGTVSGFGTITARRMR